MEVTGIFTIECECGAIYKFPADEADFDLLNTEERSMGPENSYGWENSFTCRCGNEIEFEYEVWEYPAGAFKDDDVTISGGNEIGRYDYHFIGEAISEEPEE